MGKARVPCVKPRTSFGGASEMLFMRALRVNPTAGCRSAGSISSTISMIGNEPSELGRKRKRSGTARSGVGCDGGPSCRLPERLAAVRHLPEQWTIKSKCHRSDDHGNDNPAPHVVVLLWRAP